MNDCPDTIEELLKSRNKSPKASLKWAKDVCRRIKKLEKEMKTYKIREYKYKKIKQNLENQRL